MALNVGIIGSGIGGLTAAIALRRHGLSVSIFEKASTLGEVGAGITLTPNSNKVLRALDLEDEVMRWGFEPENHVLRNWKSGRILFPAPLRDQYRSLFGASLIQIHRPEFHRILSDQIPSDLIHLRKKCVSVRANEHGAEVGFEDGTHHAFDVLIGADGIHSVVRESMFGPDKPHFTGNICWRGTVEARKVPDFPIMPDVTNWLGPRGHVVHYYTRAAQDLINFIAIHENESWGAESWSEQGDNAELVSQFGTWNPALLALFRNAHVLFKWALFDRDPLPEWGKGRVTLLGDAAHPMLPFLGQGAAMAIEDSYALGSLLKKYEADPTRGLRKYEELRQPRTAQAQIGSRERGKKNHLHSPVARFKRDSMYLLRRIFRAGQTPHQTEWIYGYDLPRILD